jgi:hypothetical protein
MGQTIEAFLVIHSRNCTSSGSLPIYNIVFGSETGCILPIANPSTLVVAVGEGGFVQCINQSPSLAQCDLDLFVSLEN